MMLKKNLVKAWHVNSVVPELCVLSLIIVKLEFLVLMTVPERDRSLRSDSVSLTQTCCHREAIGAYALGAQGDLLRNLGSLVLPEPRLCKIVALSAPSLGTSLISQTIPLATNPLHWSSREHHWQTWMSCNLVTLLRMALLPLTVSREEVGFLLRKEGQTSPHPHGSIVAGLWREPRSPKGTTIWMSAKRRCLPTLLPALWTLDVNQHQPALRLQVSWQHRPTWPLESVDLDSNSPY